MTDADANTAAAIRAALDALPAMPENDAEYAEWDDYTAVMEIFESELRLQGRDWLRYLLAENERLQAVAEAAGAFDFSEFVWYDREDGRYCQFCNAEYKASDHSDFVHDSNCPIDKLQAAVREVGEGE